MGAGRSGFSLGRAINRRRYFYALIAADPNQAVTRAVGYWVSTGGSARRSLSAATCAASR